ncbi:MAG: transporter [Gammaproteobacteria bacterium]
MTRKISAGLLLFLLGNTAFAGEYSLSAGIEYTQGDYGGAIDTSMLYMPFALTYQAEKYMWRITVPYVRISGSEDVLFSSTTRSPMFSTNTISSRERTDSGLGDIIVTGRYLLQKETRDDPWLAMTANVKLGTADKDKLLGTGENDYSLQLDAAKQALHGYVGYEVIGDSANVDYNNVLFAAAGVSLPVGDNLLAGIELYAEQAAVSGRDNVTEATLSLSKPLGKDKRLSIYMLKGFTDVSPDWGLGAVLVHQL